MHIVDRDFWDSIATRCSDRLVEFFVQARRKLRQFLFHGPTCPDCSCRHPLIRWLEWAPPSRIVPSQTIFLENKLHTYSCSLPSAARYMVVISADRQDNIHGRIYYCHFLRPGRAFFASRWQVSKRGGSKNSGKMRTRACTVRFLPKSSAGASSLVLLDGGADPWDP